MLKQLQRLVDAGNTVVLVEPDMRIVAQTDYVIDMGPGAGSLGGTICRSRNPATRRYITRQYHSSIFKKSDFAQEVNLVAFVVL